MGKREEKICKNCGKQFWPLSIKVRQGKGIFCSIDCYREYRKKHAQDPKVSNKFYQKKHKYKISRQDYENLILAHNNKCAICNNEFDDQNFRCNIDHCHKTNKVRGLLCTKCNFLLGLCNDSIEILQNAIKYLNNNS